MKPISIAVIVATLAAACSGTEPSLESLTVVTDRTSYVVPATVKVTLTNLSSQTVRTGACASLERDQGDEWHPLPIAPCPAVLRELSSGRSISVDINVPAGTPAGEYRAAMGVSASVVVPEIPSLPFGLQ